MKTDIDRMVPRLGCVNGGHLPETPAERATATDRRKAIWERLHPETKAGTAGGKASGRARNEQPQDSAPVDRSFTESTAAVTGRSRRSVEVDAQIGAALRESPEAAAVVHAAPKPLTQAALLTVAKAPAEKRADVAVAAVEKGKRPKFGPGKGRKPKTSSANESNPATATSNERSWRNSLRIRDGLYSFVWGDSETTEHEDPHAALDEFLTAIGAKP